MPWLNAQQVEELTRRKQPKAQMRVLQAAYIPFTQDEVTGQVIVTEEGLLSAPFAPYVTTELYRHFDSEGTLLYIGISLSALARTAAHKSSGWWGDVTRIEIERYPTRACALKAEEAAIRDEMPLHNKQHNGGDHAAAD